MVWGGRQACDLKLRHGKTLGESGADLDRMFLISSAITKAFHGEQGAYARYRQMEDGTKAEGAVLHFTPKERRVLMDALLEQRMRQEKQMTGRWAPAPCA